jgi:hypothetical protein
MADAECGRHFLALLFLLTKSWFIVHLNIMSQPLLRFIIAIFATHSFADFTEVLPLTICRLSMNLQCK